jgi:hypothetical protein
VKTTPEIPSRNVGSTPPTPLALARLSRHLADPRGLEQNLNLVEFRVPSAAAPHRLPGSHHTISTWIERVLQ